MHYPQMPDMNGWDVRATYYAGLADDFLCGGTGPITDFHIWTSYKGDVALLPSDLEFIHTAIYADIPDPDGAGPLYSMPGAMLWHHDWQLDPAIGTFSVRPWGEGVQGWYDPLASLVLEEDTVAAGEHAIVHVRLQPFRRQAIVRTFSVQIPATSSGSVTLLVRGGDVPRDIDDVPEEGGEVDEPRSFPELLEALRGQLQASELVIESIDEDGAIRRLSRTSLPFVVLDSQEVTVTVTGAAGAEQEAERQDQESDPGTTPDDEEQEDE